MGTEDFRVRIESRVEAAVSVQVLVNEPGVIHDPTMSPMPGSAYLRLEDPHILIEFEVCSAPSGSTTSVRFALCHPTTTDSVFADWVDRLSRKLSGTCVIQTDVDPTTGLAFESPDLVGLSEAVAEAIRHERQLWQVDFGRNSARLSCRAAIQRYILDRNL